MKKFVKACLIIAAVLAVAGISFCIAGAVCGVDYEKLRELPVYREKIQELVVTADAEGNEFEETYSGIRNLELDIGVTAVEITGSSDDMFHVYGSNLDSSFACFQDGDTLEIESERKGRLNKKTEERIVIEVPEGTVFEEAELTVGIGELEADSLYCRDLSIDCGMGSVYVNGRVEGNCEIDCGVGEVSMNLENAESDFDYDIQCGIGEVILGETSYSGISREKEIDNHAGKNMDIDCGVGSVLLAFDKE